MASIILNVRMQEDLHADFIAFCKSIHIPASTLMAAFAAQTVRLGRVPFDLYGDEVEVDLTAESALKTAPKQTETAPEPSAENASHMSTKQRGATPEKRSSAPANLSAMIPRISDTTTPAVGTGNRTALRADYTDANEPVNTPEKRGKHQA